MSELSNTPSRLRGDGTVETLRTVQRYAEALIADAKRVLTRCVSGQLDTNAVAEDLHAIDRSAASIRVEIGTLEGDSSR
jgi:methylthioribose-1-phosphate isomerase